MPTVITHPAVAVATAMAAGRRLVSGRLLAAAAIASCVPDADSIGFRLGIPYGHVFGHRGFSHSIAFALLIGLLGVLFATPLRAKRSSAFLVLFIATVSHGLLDAVTTGGLGVAFFSPFSNERFFFPWQFIKVSPLSLRRMLTPRGLEILRSEFLWVWLPFLSLGALAMLFRKLHHRFGPH